jgi:hypothetical protein
MSSCWTGDSESAKVVPLQSMRDSAINRVSSVDIDKGSRFEYVSTDWVHIIDTTLDTLL